MPMCISAAWTPQQQSRATLTRMLHHVRRLQRELFEEEVPAHPPSPISVAGHPSSVSCEQDPCLFSMHRLTLIGVLCQNVFQLHRTAAAGCQANIENGVEELQLLRDSARQASALW